MRGTGSLTTPGATAFLVVYLMSESGLVNTYLVVLVLAIPPSGTNLSSALARPALGRIATFVRTSGLGCVDPIPKVCAEIEEASRPTSFRLADGRSVSCSAPPTA